jgi:hypothetical protein
MTIVKILFVDIMPALFRQRSVACDDMRPVVPRGSDASGAQFAPIRVALRDGRSVTIRAVRADDAEGLWAAMVRLSDEARYTRSMAPLRELSPAMLERAGRRVRRLGTCHWSYFFSWVVEVGKLERSGRRRTA